VADIVIEQAWGQGDVPTGLFDVTWQRVGSFSKGRLAQEIALDLANGQADAVTPTGQARFEWERAQTILEPAGLRLDEAAKQLADVLGLLHGGRTASETASFFATNRPKVNPRISVRQAADEFIEAHQREEASRMHLRDLRHRLGKFADASEIPVSFLSAQAVERFLETFRWANAHATITGLRSASWRLGASRERPWPAALGGGNGGQPGRHLLLRVAREVRRRQHLPF